jgi:hypothetical protein
LNKAQKIILLAAAMWIVYLLLFQRFEINDATIGFNRIIWNHRIDWGWIGQTVVIAGVAFVIAGLRRPGKKLYAKHEKSGFPNSRDCWGNPIMFD